jgi:undecaprenyl-diphosphatase
MSTVDAPPRRSVLSSPAVAGLDGAAAVVARHARGRGADRAIYLLSQAANHSMLWHGINLVDAVVGGRSHRRRALRRSVIVAVEQAAVNGPIKALVARDRPDARTDHPHGLRTPRTSSFPSGHASAAACSATLLTKDLGVGPLWWSLALAVSWSRVHVGVHHASDVAGGLAVGRTLARVAGVVWPVPSRR